MDEKSSAFFVYAAQIMTATEQYPVRRFLYCVLFREKLRD
jgi:hypothetical protein